MNPMDPFANGAQAPGTAPTAAQQYGADYGLAAPAPQGPAPTWAQPEPAAQQQQQAAPVPVEQPAPAAPVVEAPTFTDGTVTLTIRVASSTLDVAVPVAEAHQLPAWVRTTGKAWADDLAAALAETGLAAAAVAAPAAPAGPPALPAGRPGHVGVVTMPAAHDPWAAPNAVHPADINVATGTTAGDLFAMANNTAMPADDGMITITTSGDWPKQVTFPKTTKVSEQQLKDRVMELVVAQIGVPVTAVQVWDNREGAQKHHYGQGGRQLSGKGSPARVTLSSATEKHPQLSHLKSKTLAWVAWNGNDWELDVIKDGTEAFTVIKALMAASAAQQ